MKVLSKFAGLSRKAIVLSVLTVAVAGIAGFTAVKVEAQNISIGGASDCDSNAVMYCGAHSTNEIISKYNNSGSVRDIYEYFGIGPNEVRSMDSNGVKVVAGKVTKSGAVLDNNGKVVATSALTGGREYIAGSNHVSNRGTSFYTRPPSVSFVSNSLDAFVVLKDNGEFKFAILASCGNPVKASPKHVQPPKPEKKPAYEVEKKVKVKGSGNEYSKSVKVKPGTHVIYTVNVKSTGDAAVQNVNVKDNLPAHVEYVKGTLNEDGKNVGPTQAAKFFGSGVTVDRIAPSTTVKFTFEAIVGPKANPDTCKDEKLTNTGKINSPQLPPKDSSADVKKECKPPKPPKPEYACENLSAVANSRVSYTFKAKASASNGAKITSYHFNFGDGSTKTVTGNAKLAVTSHSYPDLKVEKSYNASVTVTVIVDGKTKTVTSETCKVPVKIAPKPPVNKPSAECTSLKLTVGKNRSITATTSVRTHGNVSLTSINYDFDDGTNLLVNNLQPVSHTYTADGEYLVKATVTFNIEGKNSTSVCKAPVTFTPRTPTCEEKNGGKPCVETCEEQHGEQACVTCEEQNGGEVCEEVTTCEETVAEQGKGSCEAAPTELVNTGPGETAAMFVAVTALGAIGYRMLLSRRLSQQ
jgi:uncharacterized repeat protein (TIGR01451 family)